MDLINIFDRIKSFVLIYELELRMEESHVS